MDRQPTQRTDLDLGPMVHRVAHREKDPWLPQRRAKVLGLARWLRHRFHREDGSLDMTISRDYTEIELTVETPYYGAAIELRTKGIGEIWEGSIFIVDYENELGNTHPWDHIMDFCEGCPYDSPEGCTYEGEHGCTYLET
ncbi:MAG: hypothetical protein DRJ03_26370, partial [Chloroflexi bacterium]